MGAFFSNGRIRAALVALAVSIAAYLWGIDIPEDVASNVLATIIALIAGSAIPSELWGTKNK